MKHILTLSLALLCLHTFAQFPIGHRQITYQDPARSNRSVPMEVYYPGASTGDNVAFATGQFPLIVFGHGFVMGYDAYAFWKNNLVPAGYIIAFPTTEGSMSPSHAEFGADLAFLLNQIKSEAATNSGSPFYQKLMSTSAVMGHSMGGGSSFLACAGNSVPTCMVTFAAAETTPSSTTAAASVTIPTLVMSGAEDCVAPPASHQTPMYNALASPCKVFVSIVAGIHCYFGDYNFNCTFGESTCNPVPSIQRADQEDVALDFTLLYLNHYLKGVAADWATFTDSLNTSTRITHLISCPSTGSRELGSADQLKIYPNPVDHILRLEIGPADHLNAQISVFDMTGLLCYSMTKDMNSGQASIDISSLKTGIYLIEVRTGSRVFREKMIVD